jgi:hypothetical protein
MDEFDLSIVQIGNFIDMFPVVTKALRLPNAEAKATSEVLKHLRAIIPIEA